MRQHYKSEHWAACPNLTLSWYDWKIVENDVKPEQTTTTTIWIPHSSYPEREHIIILFDQVMFYCVNSFIRNRVNWQFLYTEHQWSYHWLAYCLNTGGHSVLSGQRIAVCSSVQLSFLWCTVLCIGTSENGIHHTWMHYTLSLMNSRCFHWVL